MYKKKILVLAMSCNQDHFREQEKVVRETWAKPILEGKYDNIDYWSYTASSDNKEWIDKEKHVIYCSGGDGIYQTYQKSVSCFRQLINNNIEFDYIYRTNTSTVLNVGLLNAFVQTLNPDDMVLWGGELYAIGVPCPTPYSIYLRGNSLIMSKKHIEMILDLDKYVTVPPKYFADDNVFANILNLGALLSYIPYKVRIKSYGFAWYKCATWIKHSNGCSTWNNSNKTYEYLKDFIAIQIRSYEDRSLENDRIREISDIINKDKDDYSEELEFIREYSKDPYYWYSNGREKKQEYRRFSEVLK